jgi:hypothetical protein
MSPVRRSCLTNHLTPDVSWTARGNYYREIISPAMHSRTHYVPPPRKSVSLYHRETRRLFGPQRKYRVSSSPGKRPNKACRVDALAIVEQLLCTDDKLQVRLGSDIQKKSRPHSNQRPASGTASSARSPQQNTTRAPRPTNSRIVLIKSEKSSALNLLEL